MADISDVTAYIASTAATAVYPNGTSQPSVANLDVQIYEGWPIPEQLDLDLAGQMIPSTGGAPVTRPTGKRAHVSIYPPPSSSRPVYQILDETYTIAQPVLGLTVTVSGNQITITGTPNAGEFVTLVVDRQHVYSEGGATAAAILSALLTDAQVNYPSTTLVGSTLTLPYGYELDVRQGGVGTQGKVIHRECQSVWVTVWAPDHASRTALAKAIDVAIKSTIVTTLAVDNSQVKVVCRETRLSDDHENVSIYRRDLIYDCEYATVLTFPATTITSVATQITKQDPATSTPPVVTVTT